MLARPIKSFIDLGKKPEVMEKSIAAEQPSKPYYPSFYVDKDIGLTNSDLDQEMIATVKISPKRISKSVTNGKESYSCDIEVREIKLGKSN